MRSLGQHEAQMALARLKTALALALLLGMLTASPRPSVSIENAGGDSSPESLMVLIPAGDFLMGDNAGQLGEYPQHSVVLDAFYLDRREVTSEAFAKFVKATGFISEAERWQWSLVFRPHASDEMRVPGAEWWAKVDGADWRHPTGPNSSIDNLGTRPVVQVSWNDARAYCNWAGKRLPTEAEWEYAARGGLEQKQFPWGNDRFPENKIMANVWEGDAFPRAGELTDGFASPSPVGSFSPNAFGLHDMSGNVWKWVGDWFDRLYYAASPAKNPSGPKTGTEKVMRGGSWLCASNYCSGYRVAHRNKSEPDSAWDHAGFRCAVSVKGVE